MMKDGKSIVLIGMPVQGRVRSVLFWQKRIGYQFLDADLLIQEQEGMLLKDIIATKGHDGFLAVENQVNRDVDAKHSVIATGGSAVYCEEAMLHYKDTCQIVYLRCPYEILTKRLGDLKGRGVALKEGQTLLDLYEERSVLYEKYADIIIDEDNKGIEETLELLKEKFCQHIHRLILTGMSVCETRLKSRYEKLLYITI